MDRIIRLAGAGIQQGRHEALVIGGSQSQHGKAMMKACELACELMRGQISRNKVDLVEPELIRSGLGDGQVSAMYRIKGAAKQGQLHLLFLFLNAARLGIRRTLCAFFLVLRSVPDFLRALGFSCT